MEWIPAKTIVTRCKDTSWFGCDYNMNIYKGCCHGCIYCDSRSACYGVEEFDRVRAKEQALRIVRDDLRRKVLRGVVATGAMSDPYNPFEEEFQLTRHALELVGAYGFGAASGDQEPTGSAGRGRARRNRPAGAGTDQDYGYHRGQRAVPAARAPCARPRRERFSGPAGALAERGLFTGVLLMPVLPFLEDSEENVLTVVETARANGARFVYPAFGVTLRQNQREYFLEKLDALFPGQKLADKYRARYGERYKCVSPAARRLWKVFSQACDDAGLLYRMPEIIRAYRSGYEQEQLSLY